MKTANRYPRILCTNSWRSWALVRQSPLKVRRGCVSPELLRGMYPGCRRPNPRVQRTRVARNDSPLTRHPFGGKVARASLLLALAAGCQTTAPPAPQRLELWQELGCFAHSLLPVEESVARQFIGSVVQADVPEHKPLPQATVAVRGPDGIIRQSQTGEDDRFLIPNLPAGRYEATACLAGFNPWRGVVSLSESAAAGPMQLPIRLGR